MINIFLGLLSGALLIFSFPRFDIYPLAFISLVPLIFSIDRGGKKYIPSFFYGWLFGVVFFIGHLYWIPDVKRIGALGVPALLVLSSYLAIYLGLFSVGYTFFSREKIFFLKTLAVSSWWVILEFIRSLGVLGFPWGSLCYSQYNNLPLIQISEITGMWGVSFLIVMTNLVIFKFLEERRLKGKYLLFFVLFFSIYIWGHFKIIEAPCPCTLKKVALVQGNTERDVFWDNHHFNFTVNEYMKLSENALRRHPDIDIVIWPETVLPYGDLQDNFLKDTLVEIAKKLNRYFIVGCFDSNKYKNEYYNAAVVFSPAGELLGKYYKIQIVLFGETVPHFLKYILNKINYDPWQDGGVNLTRGKKFQVVRTPLGDIGFNICFETIFPYISRNVSQGGAQVIVALVADSWFKSDTTYQHTAMAVFRAVETRRYILRCADTGISAIINPYGKIEKRTEPFVPGTLIGNFSPLSKKTFYTKYGEVFVLFCLIYVFVSGIILKIKK